MRLRYVVYLNCHIVFFGCVYIGGASNVTLTSLWTLSSRLVNEVNVRRLFQVPLLVRKRPPQLHQQIPIPPNQRSLGGWSCPRPPLSPASSLWIRSAAQRC